MNTRLRLLLGALSDAQAYKRSIRLPLFFVILALIAIVAIVGGSAYAVWRYWWTLLLINTLGINSFADGVYGIFSIIYPFLYLIGIPLGLARQAGNITSEPFALAVAVRRALEAGDGAIAPVVAAPPEEGEPRTFASATPSADSLVVAIPDALLISRAGPISLTLLATLALGLAAGGAALASTFLNIPFDQLLSAQAGQIYLVAVCGSLTFLGLLMLLLARRQSRHRRLQLRGLEVALDDMGLSFHQPVWTKRQRQIAWADIRALGRFTYKDKHTREQTVYVLASEAQTLVWEEPPTERYALPADRRRIAALQDSSWNLATIITRRTSQPIRDLSGALTILADATSTSSSSTPSSFLAEAYDAALAESDLEMATTLWRLRRPGARKQPRALRTLAGAMSALDVPLTPLDTPATSTIPARLARYAEQISSHLESMEKKQKEILQLARALIPRYPSVDAPETSASYRRFLRRERVFRSLAMRLSWVMLFVILMLFAGTAVYAHDEQDVTRLIDALPQQTTAQKPLYYAALVNPQSDWTVQKASKDDPTAAAFVHSAYQVSCDDPTVSAIFTIPRNEKEDIALSVSETIHSPTRKDDYATGGLVFDLSSDGNAFSTFGVDEHGSWYLMRYDANHNAKDPWNEVDSNTSSAIRTGENATNTLLLVRHGPLYLLYVNGELMEHFYDSGRALPPGGEVGVYIDACNIVASFNNFSSYPVPPRLAAIPVTPDLPGWLTN